MQKSSTVVVVAGLLIVLSVGGYLLLSPAGDSLPPPSTVLPTIKAQVQSTSPPTASEVVVTPEKAAPIVPVAASRSAYDEFTSANDLKAFYDKLALRNDGEAKYFMARAFATCVQFVEKSPAELEEVFKKIGGSDENPVFRARMAALRQLGQRCVGFHKFRGPEITALLRDAADKGYPAAIATELLDLQRRGKGDEAKTLAVQMLGSASPAVLESILPFMELGSKQWTVGDPAKSPRTQIIADAWRLYACSKGAYCAGDSAYLLELCYTGANCGSSSFEEYLLTQKYSLSDQEELRRARQIISTSIESRNWAALGLGQSWSVQQLRNPK